MDDVLDSYELSPMQQGMLFHAVSEHPAGVDIEQIIVTLRESLDLTTFEQAWRDVMQRHTILRTRFRWKDGGEPCQEMLAQAEHAATVADWRDFAPALTAQRFVPDRSKAGTCAAAAFWRDVSTSERCR